jgi:hypothetical protein
MRIEKYARITGIILASGMFLLSLLIAIAGCICAVSMGTICYLAVKLKRGKERGERR